MPAGRLSEEVKLPFEDPLESIEEIFLHNRLGHVFENADTVVKKVNRLNHALLFWSGLIKCLATFVQMLVLSISKTVLLPLDMLRI